MLIIENNYQFTECCIRKRKNTYIILTNIYCATHFKRVAKMILGFKILLV